MVVFCEGGATLIFSVELVELKRPSMVSWNKDSLTIVGVVLLVVLLLYEVFRRMRKETDESKLQKRAAKRGSKKKR